MIRKIMPIFLFVLASNAWSSETVTISYAFGHADNMANYARTLIVEANSSQKKYIFVFNTKPGGGGAVAANWLLNNPNNIVQHSSAFFIRPSFYPNDSYNIDHFKELLPQCIAPMAISSLKYKSWNTVPKDKPLTVGIAGLGSATHLIANQIIKVYPNITLVPFKNTSEIFVAMIGGHVDFTISLLGIPEEWNKGTNKLSVNILGITGNQSINGYALLINQGFPDSLEHDAYAIDHCKPIKSMSDKQTQIWFDQQIDYWKDLSRGEKN